MTVVTNAAWLVPFPAGPIGTASAVIWIKWLALEPLAEFAASSAFAKHDRCHQVSS